MILHGRLRSSFWIATSALAVVAGGCTSVADPVQGGGNVPPDIHAFVVAELPRPREITIEYRDDVSALLIFSASYGEPQDCPSGCFYAGGSGLSYRGQIGWIRRDGLPPTVTFYGVKSDDAALFSGQLWDRLQSHYISGPFRIMLACDGDTPAAALVRLAERLPQEGWPFFASLLLNEAQRRDVRPVAEVIARLSSSEWNFSAPRERAALVLNNWPGLPLSGLDCSRS